MNKKTTTDKGGLLRGEAPKGQPRTTITKTSAPPQLVEKLQQIGLPDSEIFALLSQYPRERIVRQLEMLPYRNPIKPSVIFRNSLSENWSTPYGYLKANPSAKSPFRNADLTQEKLAHIKAEQSDQKRLRQKLVAIEKKLKKHERDALLQQAEKRVRQRLGNSWPRSKPIRQTFLSAEYYRLIEIRFVLKRT